MLAAGFAYVNAVCVCVCVCGGDMLEVPVALPGLSAVCVSSPHPATTQSPLLH